MRLAGKVAIGGVVLALVATAGIAFAPRPFRRAAKLFVTDELRVLRPELRPDRAPRVLIVALDGVGYEQLRRALEEGGLPTVSALLGKQTAPNVFEHGYSTPGVLSVLPSTTVVAWASVFTGLPPAEHGVAGNEWFEREKLEFHAPAPVSVREHGDTLRTLMSGLVGNALQGQTLFERADRRSYVSLSQIYRGADLFTAPGSSALLGLLSDFHRLLSRDKGGAREAYSELDDESAEVFVEAIDEHGLPSLAVVYFPGIDLFTHVADGDPLAQQRDYLKVTIDHSLGQVLDAYRARGALDELRIVITSDHGHTPVVKDDVHSLYVDGDDEPTELIRQLGFRIRPAEADDEGRDFQAVVAYQGAFAYVYLADRSSCEKEGSTCDWMRPPRLEEDVLAVARAFHRASQTGEGLPALKGAIDLIFARQGTSPDQPAPPFQVFDGERLVPIAQYLAAHPREDLVELESRLDGLARGKHGHRAGDVLLLTKTGYYFSKEYSSWHGSPSAQDGLVPLIVVQPNGSGEALKARVHAAGGERPTQLSVTPVVLELLRAE